ncbi:hypothetical protein [Caldicellulosiruptor bescii]|nr:hypothetical protein [Caldicellulosiruptor bescii]
MAKPYARRFEAMAYNKHTTKRIRFEHSSRVYNNSNDKLEL